MAGFGDLILNLIGNKDPRREMLATMGQPQALMPTGAPQAGDRAPAGAAGGPGMTTPAAGQPAPAAPQVAAAYQSPPDLSALYEKLITRAERAKQIDQGIGILAANFAHPENKQMILNASGIGGSSGTNADPTQMFNNILTLREKMQKQAADATLRANLPALAQKYGLTLESVMQLYSGGQLEDYIKQQEAPNRVSATDAYGRPVAMDLKTGSQLGAPIGPEKPMTRSFQGADGRNYMIDERTNAPVGEPAGPAAVKTTDDLTELAQINTERAKAGQPPLSAQEWLENQAERKASRTTITTGDRELDKQFASTYKDEFEAAQGAANAVRNIHTSQAALEKGIIAGSKISPYELEGRKLIGHIFGIPDDKIANTETFTGSMQEALGQTLKSYGSGASITDKDREYVLAAIGGSIELNPQSIRNLLNIQEKASRNKAILYNQSVNKLKTERPESSNLVRSVEIPTFSAEYKRSVDPRAIQLVRQHADDPEAIKKFEETFGIGAAKEIAGIGQ